LYHNEAVRVGIVLPRIFFTAVRRGEEVRCYKISQSGARGEEVRCDEISQAVLTQLAPRNAAKSHVAL